MIPEDCHRLWFQQIWDLGGASTKHHPAPYPLALAERIVRMFSFVGDTVLDPFMGTGTTNLAAGRWGRNSIGFEIEPRYFEMACRRTKTIQEAQLTNPKNYCEPSDDLSAERFMAQLLSHARAFSKGI